MTFNTKDIVNQLDNLFETQVKAVINNTWNHSEKINIIKEEIRKRTTIHIISILKDEFNIDDDVLLEDLKLKNTKKLRNNLTESGNSLLIIYKKGRPIHISGEWDNINECPIETKKGVYIGVYKQGLGGFINENGIITVKPKYHNIEGNSKIINTINEKYFWVGKNKDDYSYGLINLEGREITPFHFFISGKRLHKINKKSYIQANTLKGEGVYNISDKNNLIEFGKYKTIKFNENYNSFIVKSKNNKFGIISENNIHIPIIYDQLNILNENIIQVTENKKIGLLDINGSKLSPIKYDKIVKYNKNGVIVLKYNEHFYDIYEHGIKIKTIDKGVKNENQ